MTLPRLSPADELAEIRAEIARLRQREAALLTTPQDTAPRPPFRQGWPIHRSGQSHAQPGHA